MSGSVHSYPVLGASAVLRVSGVPLPDATLKRIRERWAALEDRFDVSRPNSELSLVTSGRNSVKRASAEFQAAHADALRWRSDTGGYFPPRRSGEVLDVGGLIPAYEIRDAAAELTRAGLDSWLIELGGDVMSDALGSGGWTAPIADPADGGRLLSAVQLGGSWTAVATARPDEPKHDGEFVQASVLGRDIVAAKALAMSVVAGGASALAIAIARWRVDVLTVDSTGEQRCTPRLERRIRRAMREA